MRISNILFVGFVCGIITGFPSVHAQKVEEPFVRITTPDPDDRVPIGNLTIYGRSSDNATTPCLVSVSLNGEWPPDSATPSGPAGKEDYSRWKYTFDPYFALIEEGENLIESNIFCQQAGNNSTAWDSINVTGEPQPLKWLNRNQSIN
jgi:hypothetical protein